ncbi:Putative serine esterase [Zhongshania aliphaticivorans]|uniref:Serine esterase n=1 Tax=Zhongshania aliphaticivorans TaxID=1470434 RepID=A0A5S9MRS8_9GAMM|nr:CocE/NonD family hydrolase [Zhongshania aliphaticivorans]CAA0079496.1 Putative serine esterase [Zhongshania aliphaticivorans]CAA0086115.1 Putative serine esterase [Zhongshania aliphaticivorans]
MKLNTLIPITLISALSFIAAGCSTPSDNKESVALPSKYPAEWGVTFRKAASLPPSLEFGRKTLKYSAGDVFPPAALPLPCDIIHERDIPVTLRDGVVIYTDILRPADIPYKQLPAIISWSPYGKRLPTPPPKGVPPEWFSGLAKFEGADAAFWSCNGYAVVNPDARGAFNSEGAGHAFGMVEAGDGYDVIEWVANQEWSNGKVGLYGTSWLAISQWFIAALQPPHLAAIAPWNGMSDLYRDNTAPGGIPDTDFAERFHKSGVGMQEDMVATFYRQPYMTPYMEDKAAVLENVNVPAYVGTDNTTMLHRFGAYEGFRRISSENKWLRINNKQEWYDQYNPESEQDLLRFYDRYLKGVDNGWENTPKVRLAVLDPGGDDLLSVPFSNWPLPDTEYRKYYLDASSKGLSTQPAEAAAQLSYESTGDEVSFTITFNEDTRLIGYSKLRLWVEAESAPDMDLFVLVEKLDVDGTLLDPRNDISKQYLPSPPGLPGRLRVSLRELDPDLSTDFMPVQRFVENDYLESGEIVPVDIRLYPSAILWHAGQQLRLTVAGHHIDRFDELNDIPTVNEGNHIIHTGPEHRSYLQLPIVPIDE